MAFPNQNMFIKGDHQQSAGGAALYGAALFLYQRWDYSDWSAVSYSLSERQSVQRWEAARSCPRSVFLYHNQRQNSAGFLRQFRSLVLKTFFVVLPAAPPHRIWQVLLCNLHQIYAMWTNVLRIEKWLHVEKIHTRDRPNVQKFNSSKFATEVVDFFYCTKQ